MKRIIAAAALAAWALACAAPAALAETASCKDVYQI